MGVTIKVLLVDDDALVRAGLRMILTSAADLEIVGEVEDGSAAAEAVRRLRPQVVLMDIRMPIQDGIATTAQLRTLPDPPEVIVLTTFSADEYVLRALRAGASGFLLKDAPPTDIIAAVRLVVDGQAMLSPAATKALVDHVGASAADTRAENAEKRLAALTERELEVAIAVGSGQSNAEIGLALFMTEATVKAHVSRVLAKLDCTNRVQVAILVHDARLT